MSTAAFQRPGFLTLTVRAGEGPAHVPAHLDVLSGAARAASGFDGGAVDRALAKWGAGGRVTRVYHARASFGRPGEQHVGFDDVEERLGMSRSYKVEIADPAGTASVVAALRDLAAVESAAVQQLFVALPAAPPSAPGVRPLPAAPTREQLWSVHERVRAREALALEPGDERVSVAVVDTGVALGHPELQRKCLAGYDTVDMGLGALNAEFSLVGDSRGYDFNPRDEVGHGSQVAGIVGGQGWRIPPGVAGRALLLPVRVLAAALAQGGVRPLGVGAIADINAGMKVAVDLGADVINMSFGTPESTVDPDAAMPHRRSVAYASHYGCVCIAAAGNSGRRERFFPAAHPEVIAVGATDTAGTARARFSTWGAHVALCAPGERVIGVGLRGYQVNSGTSFAAPYVAGAAALLVARARRAGRRLDGGDVRRLLTSTATPIGGGRNEETGDGLLDVAAALRLLDVELAGGRETRAPPRAGSASARGIRPPPADVTSAGARHP